MSQPIHILFHSALTADGIAEEYHHDQVDESLKQAVRLLIHRQPQLLEEQLAGLVHHMVLCNQGLLKLPQLPEFNTGLEKLLGGGGGASGSGSRGDQSWDVHRTASGLWLKQNCGVGGTHLKPAISRGGSFRQLNEGSSQDRFMQHVNLLRDQ